MPWCYARVPDNIDDRHANTESPMTAPSTYRSVVHDLVSLIEQQYGNRLADETLESALGPFADLYRQAKALTTEERASTVFVSRGPDGIHDASILNTGLSDVSVVVVDETISDKSGPLISIGRDDGTVFSATVKMVIPSPTDFDTDRVLEYAKREPFSNGRQVLSGVERAIATFTRWKKDSRADHYKLLKTANDAISEHGMDAYLDYLSDAVVSFKAGLLSRAKKLEPNLDESSTEAKLQAWMKEVFGPDKAEMAIAAAVYERGVDRVLEVFETEPTMSPSI